MKKKTPTKKRRTERLTVEEAVARLSDDDLVLVRLVVMQDDRYEVDGRHMRRLMNPRGPIIQFKTDKRGRGRLKSDPVSYGLTDFGREVWNLAKQKKEKATA